MNSLFSPRTVLVGALVAGASTQAFAAPTEATDADKAPGKPLHALIQYTEALQKGDKAEALKYGTELIVDSYFNKNPVFKSRRIAVGDTDTKKPYFFEVKKEGAEYCIIEFVWSQKNKPTRGSSDVSFVKAGGVWKVCERKEIEGKK